MIKIRVWKCECNNSYIHFETDRICLKCMTPQKDIQEMYVEDDFFKDQVVGYNSDGLDMSIDDFLDYKIAFLDQGIDGYAIWGKNLLEGCTYLNEVNEEYEKLIGGERNEGKIYPDDWFFNMIINIMQKLRKERLRNGKEANNPNSDL